MIIIFHRNLINRNEGQFTQKHISGNLSMVAIPDHHTKISVVLFLMIKSKICEFTAATWTSFTLFISFIIRAQFGVKPETVALFFCVHHLSLILRVP